MADYCGACANGAYGEIRAQILGDFLDDFEANVEPRLVPFLMCRLGICEGHGTFVKASMDMRGKIWLTHEVDEAFPLTEEELAEVPGPVEVPAGKLTEAQKAFIAEITESLK